MLLAIFEASLNRNIAASAAARAACVRLSGKSLRVQLTGLPNAFRLYAEGERIHLSSDGNQEATPATASLRGSPLGFLNLAAQQTAAALSSSSVRIEGDAEVAQGFSELLKQARPDLEEELSRVIGDVAAHQLGNSARSVFGFGQRAAATLLQNLGEYLSEERREVPSRTEAEEFNHAVDVLRDDVERLATRLALLERKTAS